MLMLMYAEAAEEKETIGHRVRARRKSKRNAIVTTDDSEDDSELIHLPYEEDYIFHYLDNEQV